MAVVVKCDGCDATAKDAAQFHESGTLIKRQYCTKCRLLAEEFLLDMSDLHAEIRDRHTRELKALKHKYYQFLEELPNVADRRD